METGTVADPSMAPLIVMGAVALGRPFHSAPGLDWDCGKPLMAPLLVMGAVADLARAPQVETGTVADPC